MGFVKKDTNLQKALQRFSLHIDSNDDPIAIQTKASRVLFDDEDTNLPSIVPINANCPSVRKDVWKRIFGEKLTSVSMAIGAPLVTGSYILAQAEFLLYAGGAFICLSIYSFITTLFKKSKITAEILLDYAKEHRKEQVDEIIDLIEFFSRRNEKRIADQIHSLQKKWNLFTTILDQRFTPDEMVYSRYYNAGEAVYRACYENYRDMVLVIKTAGAIDEVRLEKMLKSLGDKADTEAFNSQFEILAACKDDLTAMVEMNEDALLNLVRAVDELRKVSDDLDDSDVGTAVEDLNNITDIIHKFKPTAI